MPYPRAYLYVVGIILLTIAGFWPFYWSRLGDVPWTLHLHGLSASAWIILLLIQSWTIHNGRAPLHRALRRASLFLFPVVTMGFVASIVGVADLYSRGDEFYAITGPPFAIALAIALPANCYLYFNALRLRRQPRLHAGYMLGTLLVLFEAPTARIMVGLVPYFSIHSSADFVHLFQAVTVSMVIATSFAFYLWFRDRSFGAPFLKTALWIILQIVAVNLLANASSVKTSLREFAHIPLLLSLGLGFLIGVWTSWLGWKLTRPAPSVRFASPAE